MAQPPDPSNLLGQAAPSTDFDPFLELGDSGLTRFGGFITEEWFRQAAGREGNLLVKEMRDNHPVVGAVMFAIRNLMRQVTWGVDAASEQPADMELADFLQSCMDDMNVSWQETLSNALSFIDYGWAWLEIVFKVRQGPDETDPAKHSRFTDKKVGIQKIPLRSQDSLYRFEMDPKGNVLGMWQHPPSGGMLYIPRSRSMHLRPNSYKDNPLGRSALRNAMVPYLIQKKLQEIEAIGIERDLAGYPVITAPGRIMEQTATPAERRMFGTLLRTLRNLRRDSSEGIILPSDTDDNGNRLYDLKLMTSGGARQINVDATIQRYDQRIAMVVLADFITLGNSGGTARSGSYGMAESKTEMFGAALGAWLDTFTEEFNRQVVPALFALNNVKEPPNGYPQLTHGDVNEPNLAQIGAFITSLAGAGMPLFPDDNLERKLRAMAKFPDPNPDLAGRGDPNAQIDPVQVDKPGQNPQAKPAAAGGAGAKPASSAVTNQPGTIE